MTNPKQAVEIIIDNGVGLIIQIGSERIEVTDFMPDPNNKDLPKDNGITVQCMNAKTQLKLLNALIKNLV